MKTNKAVLFALLLLAAGCRDTSPAPWHTLLAARDDVLGPVAVTIHVVARSEAQAEEAIEAAFAAMTQVNNLLSAYQEHSEVSILNRNAGNEVHVSSQTAFVLRRAVEVSELTDGAFDVTAGPLIRLWKDAIKTKVLPAEAELERAKTLAGFRKLVLGANTARLTAPEMSVDLGGIAKGYAVDRAVEALKAHGITNALVDAGGDGYALGAKADGSLWRVGIQDPQARHGERLPQVLLLSNMAYATSGDYEQYVEIDGVRYAHIVDPRTGQPARVAASVTVLAPDCTTADAMATGLSVLGPGAGAKAVNKLEGVECMIVSLKNGEPEIVTSAGFNSFIALPHE